MRLIPLSIGWLAGLVLASIWSLPFAVWVLMALPILVLTRWRRLSRWSQPVWLLAALTLGGGRFTLDRPAPGPGYIGYYSDSAAVLLTGVVVEMPQVRDRSVTLRLRVETIATGDALPRPIEGTLQVTTFRYPVIPYGARLQLRGRLEGPVGPDGRRLAPPDIDARLFLPEVTVVATGQGQPLIHALLEGRDRARGVVVRLMPDPAAALLNAILLGDDDGLSPQLKEAFRASGLAHLTVVSGFHIAILVGVLQALTTPWLGRRGAVGATLVGLGLYVMLVGAGPSVVRAAIMGSAYLLGSRWLGRPTFTLGSLAAAVVLMTAVAPLTLWDVGFQLSAAATLGLILFAGRGQGWLARRLYRHLPAAVARPLLNVVGRPAIVSLAAQSLTLPLVGHYFGAMAPAALPANVLVIPAQAPALLLGGAATLLGLVSLPLGRVVAWLAWIPLRYTVGVVELVARLPGATVAVELSGTGVVAIYAAFAAAGWLATHPAARRRLLLSAARVDVAPRTVMLAALVAVFLARSLLTGVADGRLHVTFLDIGQGDAILIESPTGRRILVDGGLYPTRLNDHLGRRLPFWDRTIDIVVATHPDADHVAGLPGVFERYRVARLVTDGSTAEAPAFEALLAAAAAQGTVVLAPRAGDVINIEDGVRLEVVHPGLEKRSENRNDNSLSLRLVYGAFSLLLTGDAEEDAERRMLGRAYPLTAVVFKAGHHGSRSSSTAPFLTTVQPQIVVISSGADNRFGHPHAEVLARTAAAGAVVLRTDELGSVELVSDGVRLWGWAGR